MGKKKWSLKKISKEVWPRRWRLFSSYGGFKWKRLDFKKSFLDNFIFGIISVFEAIVLVATVGFFYCFCGCNF
ncbi:hypothetical protein AQUCO_01000009v1 [Aquilegia coerulea]|uniref:Uncharacterized protein n=1 Tax=Aquilegia coerulea TaxID=218851 RepID=A0A2G5E7V9_AQUCA|nr:hypothetical protein AQUCO_01000009v1 [Aquilegia coerulea]